MDPADNYVARCWAGMYRDRWVVVRLSDRRIVTEGSVHQCARWISTWAAIDNAAPKVGQPLSSRAVL